MTADSPDEAPTTTVEIDLDPARSLMLREISDIAQPVVDEQLQTSVEQAVQRLYDNRRALAAAQEQADD